jgi:transcriptional regulator with XRE-family HTH domain
MAESQTWRDLLAEIIKDPQKKQRIAAALGVHPLTLTRWARSEASPRPQLLQQLFAVVPQLRPLLADESNAFATPSADELTSEIPVTFYSHILDLYSNTPDEQRFWSICTAVLQEALKQLPRKGIGLDISVVRCLVPPQGNIIRCLREYVGLGAFSWREQVELRQRLFGAESLAGYVVASGHSTVIANLNQEQRLPHQLPDSALSAAAFPILHASRIAGCLLVASTEPDYFHVPALHDLLQSYAALLTLAFEPKDF